MISGNKFRVSSKNPESGAAIQAHREGRGGKQQYSLLLYTHQTVVCSAIQHNTESQERAVLRGLSKHIIAIIVIWTVQCLLNNSKHTITNTPQKYTPTVTELFICFLTICLVKGDYSLYINLLGKFVEMTLAYANHV